MKERKVATVEKLDNISYDKEEKSMIFQFVVKKYFCIVQITNYKFKDCLCVCEKIVFYVFCNGKVFDYALHYVLTMLFRRKQLNNYSQY